MSSFQEFAASCSGLKDVELYHTGLSLLVETYCSTKQYTKAEMLSRKMIEERSGCTSISEAGNAEGSGAYPDAVRVVMAEEGSA